ncbi:MAG: hypothetical protein ABWY56_17295 [Propionibacteriaceae bacterium]
MTEDTEREIFDYLKTRVARYHERWGRVAFEFEEAHLGRRLTEVYLVDGQVDSDVDVSSFGFSEHRTWAYETFGRPWFTAHAVVSADADISCSFEYDLPPEPVELRTVQGCATELMIYPRPAHLVPGWLKVELALVGAWDLVKDRLTVNKRWEPTGVPQTAASVGVPLPAGAEHAWSPEVFEGSTVQHPATAPPVDVEAGGWVTPAAVVPADELFAVRARWERLADEFGPLVRVLPPGAGLVPGEELVGVAPALSAVAEVLPGVALGGVVLDWPQGASQVWPELDGRFSYQPVSADGREAIVVRIDTRSGAAGEVVHLSDDGSVALLAGDVVGWWEALTSWAEEKLPALRAELSPEAADDDELSMLLEEAVEQDFQQWLHRSSPI